MTAATICYRLPQPAEMLFWRDPAEAAEAAQIVPCGDKCVGDHALVLIDGDHFSVIPAHAQEKIA